MDGRRLGERPAVCIRPDGFGGSDESVNCGDDRRNSTVRLVEMLFGHLRGGMHDEHRRAVTAPCTVVGDELDMPIPKQYIDSAWMLAAGTGVFLICIRAARRTRHVGRDRSGTNR
mgnify:CR=1 FL=1